MNELLIFTHIPKTSGSSFVRDCARKNVPADQIYQYKGIKKLLFDSLEGKKIVLGHSCYGIHHFIKRPCAYATILRDPLDHAISFYYFILQEYETEGYEHRFLPLAQEYSLIDFWKHRKMNNYQSLCLNPVWYHQLPGKPFLGLAKKALQKYRFVGLFEEREHFIKQVCAAMSWPYEVSEKKFRVTKERPKVSDLSDKERKELEEVLAKDLAIYSYAKSHCLTY